jgi:murein DD-endopeptidase MepM/ murein hydrolase activator NlpD
MIARPRLLATRGVAIVCAVLLAVVLPAAYAMGEESGYYADVQPLSSIVVRPIVFPVAGAASFRNDWGDPRGGGTRAHAGIDIVAAKHTFAVAAADGIITAVVHSNSGNAGNMVVLTDSDGWNYAYIHLNNDTPGTDDHLNDYAFAFAQGIRVGARVSAGDPIGFVGDSGNAEETPAHVHFEIRDSNHGRINPFYSLKASIENPGARFDYLCRGLAASFGNGATPPPGSTTGGGGLTELGPIRPVLPTIPTEEEEEEDPEPTPTPDSSTTPAPAPTPIPTPQVVPSVPVATFSNPISILGLGDAGFRAALGDIQIDVAAIVDIAAVNNGAGYLLLDRSGEVQEFGTAAYFGGLDDIADAGEASAIAATATGLGYWIAEAGGRIHAFGDAVDHGSPLNEDGTLTELGPIRPVLPTIPTEEEEEEDPEPTPTPTQSPAPTLPPWTPPVIVDPEPTPPALPPVPPGELRVVDLVPTENDGGYLILLSSGAVVARGNGQAHGSVADLAPAAPVDPVALEVTPGGAGYWILNSDGRVFTRGDASFQGSGLGDARCDWSNTIGTITGLSGRALWVAADDLQLWPFAAAVDLDPLRPADPTPGDQQ